MPHFRLISFAAASAMGAALIVSAFVPAIAQTGTGSEPPAVMDASSKSEMAEQRIAALKTALKITPDQEAKWNAVATAMRDNAAAMDKLVAAKRAIAPDSMTAVDDIKTYQEFAQVHLDGLKNLASAFTSLYDSMQAEQQKNADQVFMRFGSSAGKSHD